MPDNTVEEPNVEATEQVERTQEDIAKNLFDKSELETSDKAPDDASQEEENKEEDSQQGEENNSDEEKQDGDEQEETVGEKDSKEIALELSKDSPLDESYIEAVKEYAEKEGKSPEEAQEILMHKEDAVLDYIDDQKEKIDLEAERGLEQIKNDPRLGRDKFEENQLKVVQMLNDERFIPQEGKQVFHDFLKQTRIADHPVFFEWVLNLKNASSNDQYVQSNQPVKRKLSMEERWYGEKAKKE